MVLTVALFTLASLLTAALGALPTPGAPYRIQNVGNGWIFDNDNAGTEAGNHINGFFLNNDPPSLGPLAQRISVEQIGPIIGATSQVLFKISFPTNGVGAYVRGPPSAGLGLNVQNISTQFTISEVSSGTYTITYPFSSFAVTSPILPQSQLTLEALNASETRQQWNFIPFA
ncbi:hypothetical protein AURDEDRAFT_156041 [Auricularia subglabra TFB-10046 SS5]|nr:hypothetical protein AURDEDRAFT_156041 [Auricularia subglabra TFB-10046 SS5]